MRLTRAEKCVILITALFLVFAIGVHAGQGEKRDELYVSEGVSGARRPLDGTVEVKDGQQPSLNDDLPAVVNINTAGAQELMTLSGIGEKLAGRIIEYREENGFFEKPQDITLVPGIGDGIYSKICTMITV